MAKKKKLPADTNKKAKAVVDLVTSDNDEKLTKEQISELMTKLGRMGGKKGGKARAKKLSAEERTAIARKAAAARWGHKE
jgi:hypothetical protein